MKFFKTTFPGIRFAATDLDWTSGSGELVSGAANDLALTVAGRGKRAAQSLAFPDSASVSSHRSGNTSTNSNAEHIGLLGRVTETRQETPA
jgi:hypothetical protein